MRDAPQTHSSGCRSCLLATVIGAVLLAGVLYAFWPLGWAEPFGEPPPVCISQIKFLTLDVLEYAKDRQDRLPSVRTWERNINHYTYSRYDDVVCGEPGEAGKVRHVMVKRWSGAKVSSIPNQASAILIYDTVDGKPAFRHRPYYGSNYERWRNRLAPPGLGIGYVDGHCAWRTTVTAEMIANGRDLSIASDK
jgi:hypothetical protein